MADGDNDFREVAHCGGKVTFEISTDENGARLYSVGYSLSSGTPAGFFGVYALPEGIACGDIHLGGIGQPWNPPPFPECLPVFIQSDSHGRYGHRCPQCKGYFRSSGAPVLFPMACCYCGARGQTWQFLTEAQHKYVRHYTQRLIEGLHSEEKTLTVTIDMDAVGDAAVVPKPDFYFPGVVQQTQFPCAACNGWNDIKGQYGYCAVCGTRNNAQRLAGDLEEVRSKLNDGTLAPAEAVRSAVSKFDSCCRNLVAQLCERVPMTQARSGRLARMLFHDLEGKAEHLKAAFDFDVFAGIDSDAQAFLRMMFHRRHVYEHDGGQATARYVRESGDTSVAEGALIRETKENAHRLIGLLKSAAVNFDRGFHELFPPEEKPVAWERDRQARMKQRRG